MTDAHRRAVALRYRSEDDHAPRVTAKGKDRIADRILELARQHDVPLHQDTDLVHLLEVLDLGVEIPPRLYQALAEVLAHLYRSDRLLGEATRR